jgi:hypothetical protein
LWTYGVAELRSALGLATNGIMKVLRNIYGSITAPRGQWLDLHRTLTGPWESDVSRFGMTWTQ